MDLLSPMTGTAGKRASATLRLNRKWNASLSRLCLPLRSCRPIPGDEIAQAFFNSHGGIVAKTFCRFADIRPSQWNVARLLLMDFANRLAPRDVFQHFYQLRQLNGSRIS